MPTDIQERLAIKLTHLLGSSCLSKEPEWHAENTIRYVMYTDIETPFSFNAEIKKQSFFFFLSPTDVLETFTTCKIDSMGTNFF